MWRRENDRYMEGGQYRLRLMSYKHEIHLSDYVESECFHVLMHNMNLSVVFKTVNLTSYRKDKLGHKNSSTSNTPSIISKHQLSKKSDRHLNIQVCSMCLIQYITIIMNIFSSTGHEDR